MRRLYSWQLPVLLLVGMAASAQIPSNPPADAPPATPTREVPTTPSSSPPDITVTGEVPRAEQPLPKLAPDQFTECYGLLSTTPEGIDYTTMETCAAQLARDTRVVIDKCVNRDGKSATPVAIQACTELLNRKVLEGHERFYLYVNRARASFAQGDRDHALDDYTEAIKIAPKSATPYYIRGLFFAAQTNADAAMRDFDAALNIDPKLVPALRQRAILHVSQKNFGGALADLSEALRLQPKAAGLWGDRGYVYILQRDYDSAVKDEAEAIRLDPKLARAYFLRGAAFGDLGNSTSAYSDIVAAVGLDPSLDRYISTKGKTASIMLPPL